MWAVPAQLLLLAALTWQCALFAMLCLPMLGLGVVDPEFIGLVPCLEGGDEPSWLLSPAGPRLRWGFGVAVFCQHLWIFTSYLAGLRYRGRAFSSTGLGVSQFGEAPFQLLLFRDYPVRQYPGKFLVDEPEFLKGHGV